jgi:HEAT repeat protein
MRFFAFAAILVSVSCTREQESEPTAKGRALGFWLTTWVDKSSTASQRADAEAAIKQIGTNAIPFLLGELSAAERVERSKLPNSEELRLAISRGGAAAGALSLLGRSAASAIPTLTTLVNSQNYNTVTSAASVLSGLGKTGVHAMVVGLTNSNPKARSAVAAQLLTVGTNAVDVVPFLLRSLDGLDADAAFNCCAAIVQSGVAPTNLVAGFTSRLQSTNSVTRYVVAITLGKMGTNAVEAVPHLNELKNDPEKDVRDAAEWALVRVGQNR